jgi:hypothetical protein
MIPRKFLIRNWFKIVGMVVIIIFIASWVPFSRHLKNLPIYALKNRLNDFSLFETNIDGFQFDIKRSIVLKELKIFQNDQVIINWEEDQERNSKDMFLWNKEEGKITISDINISTDEARNSWILFEPASIISAISKHKYEIKTEHSEKLPIKSTIIIPESQIKEDIIQKYQNGLLIGNKYTKLNKELCFLGLVKNFNISKIETAKNISGDLVFVIDHSKWDISSIEEPLPSEIKVNFTGELCEEEVGVNGYYVSSSSEPAKLNLIDIQPENDVSPDSKFLNFFWKVFSS